MEENLGENLGLEQTQDNDRVIRVNIEEQMKTSYIDYSMSVIVGRALPDVRDGFKPVHRRVLFAMHELNFTHTVILQSMILWCVWLRNGRCVISW